MNKDNRIFRNIFFSAFATLVLLSPFNAQATTFNDSYINGSYATTIEGTFTFIDKVPVNLPAWFTGIVVADGKGKITSFSGTFNVGACMVVSHDGNGVYTVAENGLATATVQITAAPKSLPNPQCSDSIMASITKMSLMNTVKFSLTIQDKKTVYGSILSKTDPAGNLVAFGGELQAHRQ